MDNPNPYRAPIAVEPQRDALRGSEYPSRLGFEFESDWSTAGVRHRRRSDWHRITDAGFALLTIAWAVLIVAAARNSMTGGLLCIVTPTWIISGVLWMSNLIFRHAGSFSRSCRGFNGPVRGRVDAGYVWIEGPALSLAARTGDCTQSSWTPQGAAFRPPLIHELLPVVESDIRETWTTEHQPSAGKSDAQMLLNRLSILSGVPAGDDEVLASGVLRGSDLRGHACWWNWLLVGAVLSLLGAVGSLYMAMEWMNLPSWVLDPPSHYIPSQHERIGLALLIVGSIACLLMLAFGVRFALRTRARIGEFAARMTPETVAIANERVAFEYRGAALEHFAWTDRGIVVRGAKGRVVFEIPSRWMDPEDHRRLAAWFAHREGVLAAPIRSFYVGPSV